LKIADQDSIALKLSQYRVKIIMRVAIIHLQWR